MSNHKLIDMISFKLFVEAIHHAIVSASDSLMDKNEGLLDKYFEKPVDGEGKIKGHWFRR